MAKKTQKQISELTDDEIRILLARESLMRYGTALPPASVAAAAAPEKQKPSAVDYEGKTKICPLCEKTKLIIPDFGLKKESVRGTVYVQSWCRECRAGTNYHNRDRVYRQKDEVEELKPKNPRKRKPAPK